MNFKNFARILLLIGGYAILLFGVYSGILLITGGLFSVVGAFLVCALPIIAIYSFFGIFTSIIDLKNIDRPETWN